MNHIISVAMLISLTVSVWATAAEPLAQDFVVVHQVRNLDDPKKAVCVGTPDILQLPSGRLIASMELWLKRPTSGDEGGIDYPNHCKIKTSDDGGRTWQQISTNGITWGSLFYVNDALHMIGDFELSSSVPLRCRSIEQTVGWTTKADWSQLAGKKVRLRIRLRNADLYAFWTAKE